jgi:hypothetical protein
MQEDLLDQIGHKLLQELKVQYRLPSRSPPNSPGGSDQSTKKRAKQQTFEVEQNKNSLSNSRAIKVVAILRKTTS